MTMVPGWFTLQPTVILLLPRAASRQSRRQISCFQRPDQTRPDRAHLPDKDNLPVSRYGGTLGLS